ncbi:MAG TPA: cation diffusion facilitator family transporter [Streptosporangiaceae bacterium]
MSDHDKQPQQQGSVETKRTVIVAGAANIFVAVIKAIAGVLTGSSAMLAEAAHSVADTLNQVFLLTSISKSKRAPDEEHPFGYGQERYFWSLLAAFGIFILGAGFSVFEGVLALMKPHSDSGSALIAYIVLVVAGSAEATSFLRAYRQMHKEAKQENTDLVEHVQSSPDTTVKAALFEDAAAMVGLALAALGIGLRQLTGSGAYDGAASIAIGVLLVVVAFRLGLDNKDLLIGKAANKRDLDAIRHVIESTSGIDGVRELLTMHLGPEHLIVAAKVSLVDGLSSDDAEDLADQIDRKLCEAVPEVSHVFVDPTPREAERRERATRRERLGLSDQDGAHDASEGLGTGSTQPGARDQEPSGARAE